MKLGVVGTLVWDTIYGRDPGRGAFEEWGGIAYALAALEAALPEGWDVVPLVKIGRDMAPRANTLLRSLSRRAPTARFIEVMEPTNRVTLHYHAGSRRTEQLTGGVPPWRWEELGPLVADCDAVYCNFISGFECDLPTAEQLRAGFAGPIYADLHSLLLGIREGGHRVPQPLPDADRWFACFDAVQVNDDEMALLGSDPLGVAARALAAGVRLFIVTLGPKGAAYFTQGPWSTHRQARSGPLENRHVPAPVVLKDSEPTGCGDVFGATLLARLLAGDAIEPAMIAANSAAARNVTHRGATNLHFHLRGAIAPV